MCKRFQRETLSKVFATNSYLVFLVFSPSGDVDHMIASVTYFKKYVLYLLHVINYYGTWNHAVNIIINVFIQRILMFF